MLRSLRALLLFWTIFASYGFQWTIARFLSPENAARRWELVHLRNARRLVNGFARMRGVFIKVGQVLSVIGTFLPTAFLEALSELQDQVPARPFSEVEARLREAFGTHALQRFATFERVPIAAASLAQVHRATTADGRAVAVKVLYPNIEEIIRSDLRVLRWILPGIRRLLPVSRVERILDQLEAMLARETNYQNERANIEEMRKVFASRQNVVVPEVIDELTSAGVLTLSFEEGAKITDLDALKQKAVDPEAIANLLVECYLSMLFEHSVFHADPHPGNFLVREGPTLVILDYGAVERVTPALREGMKLVVFGALTKSDEQILSGLEKMGFVAAGGDRELLKRVGGEYLKALGGLKIEDYARLDRDTVEKLSGYEQIRGKLRAIMKSVEYPEGYFYVERTLALLFGLVGRLAPRVGLPGIVLPHASKVYARSLIPRTPP